MSVSIRSAAAHRPHAATWSAHELLAAKNRLSASVLKIKNVNGIGVGKSAVNVYLEHSSALTKKQVRDVVAKKSPGLPLQFTVLGRIKPETVQFHDKHGHAVQGSGRRFKG